MSESNNVKFVEANGKWLWKRYDVSGSVIFRSPEFETEREAREDYEMNGIGPIPSSPENTSTDADSANASDSSNADTAQDTAPEGGAESTVGTATEEENKPAEDNTAGTATL